MAKSSIISMVARLVIRVNGYFYLRVNNGLGYSGSVVDLCKLTPPRVT